MSDSLAMPSRARPADEPLETRPGTQLESRLVAETPAVRAFLRRLAGRGAQRGEVDDLAQDVLARALRYRETFEQGRPLSAWLRTVALRVFLDHRERRARAPQPLDGSIEEPASPKDESVEQRDALERVLVALSEIERSIVVRFHSNGESVLEIARALELPEGTVKSHLHRARLKLARRRPREEDA